MCLYCVCLLCVFVDVAHGQQAVGVSMAVCGSLCLNPVRFAIPWVTVCVLCVTLLCACVFVVCVCGVRVCLWCVFVVCVCGVVNKCWRVIGCKCVKAVFPLFNFLGLSRRPSLKFF